MENLFSENIQSVEVNDTFIRKIKLLNHLIYSIEDGFLTYDKVDDSGIDENLGDKRTVNFKDKPKNNPSLYLEITEKESEFKEDKTVGIRVNFPFLKSQNQYVFPLDYTKDDLTNLFNCLRQSFQSRTYEKILGELKKLS